MTDVLWVLTGELILSLALAAFWWLRGVSQARREVREGFMYMTDDEAIAHLLGEEMRQRAAENARAAPPTASAALLDEEDDDGIPFDGATVERLDYSVPPVVGALAPLPPHLLKTVETTGVWGPNALASAWTSYKEHNGPPGMEVNDWGFGQRAAAQPWWRPVDSNGNRMIARAAAWAWYDRRLGLADRLSLLTMPSCAGVRTPFWPRCLTWSDEQVAEVERWLADSTAEMPEVLRG